MIVAQRELTARQAEILAWISEQCRTNGYPPTIREIGSQFCIRSPNGITLHIKALIKKGYLKRGEAGRNRNISLVTDDGSCPCCGRAF